MVIGDFDKNKNINQSRITKHLLISDVCTPTIPISRSYRSDTRHGVVKKPVQLARAGSNMSVDLRKLCLCSCNKEVQHIEYLGHLVPSLF